MFAAPADRRAPFSSPQKYGNACCKIVTLHTIRNGLVSADAKLSSFVAAVYALSAPHYFLHYGVFALRPIVAESQWNQA
jgi:hypothetical protein